MAVICGWSESQATPQEVTLALTMAITNRTPGLGLLHHSDGGSQSAATADRRVLDEQAVRCWMSRKGTCWDSTPMERLFGSLKTEWDGDGPFDSRQAARIALFRAIEGWHDRQRLHSSIGYITPANKEQLAAAAKP